MKNLPALIASLALAILAAGCGGSKGSPAAYPPDFKVVAGDGAVSVTWTAEPEVEYWVFWGKGSSITTTNWVSQGGAVVAKAISPLVIPRLVNGETYSFTINGRTNGGPGGEGAPTQVAVPQFAGATWTLGAPMGTGRLNAVAAGASPTGYLTMAAGEGGTIYSRTTLGETTTPTNPTAPATLNSMAYGTAGWVAVGANGTAVGALDGVTWESKPTGVTAQLNGIVASLLGGYIVTGANGTILLGSVAAVWTPATSTGTTSDLHAAVLGNSRYVAVGAGGTLVTSTDGLTWTATPSGTAVDLRGVTYGAVSTTTDGVVTTTETYLAVGKAGTVLRSSDGLAWTAVAPFTAGDLNAVLYSGQFLAVGAAGGIFTSPDGVTWTARNSGTTADLTAISRTQLGYTVVGTGGTILSSY